MGPLDWPARLAAGVSRMICSLYQMYSGTEFKQIKIVLGKIVSKE